MKTVPMQVPERISKDPSSNQHTIHDAMTLSCIIQQAYISSWFDDWDTFVNFESVKSGKNGLMVANFRFKIQISLLVW